METNVLGIVIVILVVIIVALLFWRLGRQEPDHPKPERPTPTKEYYFSPDEVVFKIRHSEAALPQGIETTVVAAVRGFLGGDKSTERASVNFTRPTSERWKEMLEMPQAATANVITLPFTNERGMPFSLVRVPVKAEFLEKDSDQTVREILKGAYADLQQNNLPDLAGGYSIEDFSLNWLFSSLHHGGATGGPGGPPTEATPPTGGVQSFRVVSQITSLANAINMPTQTNAYVAILDTAPTSEAVVDTYHNKWPKHLGIERLFGTNFTGGRLTIHPANLATLYSMEHFSPMLHNYLMPDHGTFVAGIINSGAPDADLHLYQVLNRYGVGTFTSIAQGIRDAIRDLAHLGRPLIINCSFQFCLPDGTYQAALITDLGRPLAGLTYSMRQLFEVEILKYSNIMVVASAGNNSDNSANPPNRVDARFPAAFNNVIGVGALPNGNPTTNNIYTPASYSNFADDPHGTGFMTLGGEPGTGNGIRGIYISDFPGSTNNNQTGWAWWAGTSFAAAIITGWLAGELSSNSGFLPPTSTPQLGQTLDGEAVILIQQP
ncbi:MAG TPA: S8/S53 family peptidase [Anaerolineales bacterium]|nr:S8/S53 family peptidase [Anaerolineales bacterium]